MQFIPHNYAPVINPWKDQAFQKLVADYRGAHLNFTHGDSVRGLSGVIGFAGPKRVGKNTAVEFTDKVITWSNGITHQDYFAKTLYDSVSAMTGIPVFVLQDDRYKELPIDWPGAPRGLAHMTPRKLLQLTGTEMVRKHVCDSFWIDRLLDRTAAFFASPATTGWSNAFALLSDVRYVNEVAACDLIVELTRDGVSYSGEHSSEMRLPQHCIDVTITLTKDTNYVEVSAYIVGLLYGKLMKKNAQQSKAVAS